MVILDPPLKGGHRSTEVYDSTKTPLNLLKTFAVFFGSKALREMDHTQLQRAKELLLAYQLHVGIGM